MEVKINREIRDYTESVFFGLSLWQFIFSMAVVVVAVGLYFALWGFVGTETVSWRTNECGYIDTGIIPKFAGCMQSSHWFKDRGQ